MFEEIPCMTNSGATLERGKIRLWVDNVFFTLYKSYEMFDVFFTLYKSYEMFDKFILGRGLLIPSSPWRRSEACACVHHRSN